jgi:hypothetical protein
MTEQFQIHTENYIFLCRITEFKNYHTNIISHTLTFGSDKVGCVIIAIKDTSSNEAYIDRVEYDNKCAIDSELEKRGGTYELVSAALCTLKTKYPTIKLVTLIDNSHILCEEDNKLYKLNLALDYISKYNKTWYELKFNAKLPKHLMDTYKYSLKILDEPIDVFEYQVERGAFLKSYESIYNKSKTPRDFFSNLRKTLKDDYCKEVCKWIVNYMDLLQIKFFPDMWYIEASSIEKPKIYSIPSFEKKINNTSMFGGTTILSLSSNSILENTGKSIGYYKDF